MCVCGWWRANLCIPLVVQVMVRVGQEQLFQAESSLLIAGGGREVTLGASIICPTCFSPDKGQPAHSRPPGHS